MQKGYEIEVLTTDPTGNLPNDETFNGIRIRRFRSFAPNGNYYFSRRLRTYLSTNSSNYDIVHAHNYHAFPALYTAKSKNKKLIFTPHYHEKTNSLSRNFLHFAYKIEARAIFQNANNVICVSSYERKALLRHFEIDANKITVIPNGIDVNIKFSKVNKERNGNNILYVGRLEKYKGVHFLIKAVSKLNDNITLNIVGSGNYKNELKKLVKNLNMTEKVNFFEQLDRSSLIQKYLESDLFVLLSNEEAFGISVGEALALGIPCIVANTSALVEWVDDLNCFGIKYPVDIESLANMIENVSGKKISKQKFSTWDDVTDQLALLYEMKN